MSDIVRRASETISRLTSTRRPGSGPTIVIDITPRRRGFRFDFAFMWQLAKLASWIIVGLFITYTLFNKVPANAGTLMEVLTSGWVKYTILGVASVICYTTLRRTYQRAILMALVGGYLIYKLLQAILSFIGQAFGTLSDGWISYGLRGLAIALALLFVAWAYQRRGGMGATIAWKGIWSFVSTNDLFLASVCWIGLWTTVYLLLPEWWAQRWLENAPYLTTAVILIVIGVAIKRPPIIPLRYKVAPILVICANLVLINYIFLKSDYSLAIWEGWRTGVKSWWYAPPKANVAKETAVESATTIASASPSGNPGDDYLLHITDANREVAEKVIAAVRSNLESNNEQELAIQIAYLESGFRQFEPDGKTALKGVENPKDRCAWQINEDNWLAKSTELGEEYNFTQSLEACNKMAMWIWKEKGANEWLTANTARQIIAIRQTQDAPANASLGQGDAVRPAEVQSGQNPQIAVPVVNRNQIERVVPMIAPVDGQYSLAIGWLTKDATIEADGDIRYITEGMVEAVLLPKGEKKSLGGASTVRVLDARHKFSWELSEDDRIHVTITRW